MQFVLIIHEVEDYAAWKTGFDAAAELRKSAGEIEYQVLLDELDQNRVVHFSKWRSLQQAKSFFESDEVAAIRKKLGVKAPEFVYLNEVARGEL